MGNKFISYTYKAFGLFVRSQFPVYGFVPAEDNEIPDVLIERGTVPKSIEPVTNKGVLFQANETEFLMHLYTIGSFYVQQGKKITVEKQETASWQDINVFLIGRVFGALLHQRNIFTLHGSALRYKGINIIIAGRSGAGKSTLTGALLKKDAEFISDDLVAIGVKEGNPVVYPSFPVIKLWEDSLKHLEIKKSALQPVRKGLQKYYMPVVRFLQEQTTPEIVLLLHTNNNEVLRFDLLSGMEKFTALKNNTYFLRGIRQTPAEYHHFSICELLARRTKVFRLFRQNGPVTIEKMVDCVKKITEKE